MRGFIRICTVRRAVPVFIRKAQSLDWAFLMKTGTARAYAVRRTEEHIHRFNRLHEQAVSGAVDEAFLANCESRDNIFPNLCWRHYA